MGYILTWNLYQVQYYNGKNREKSRFPAVKVTQDSSFWIAHGGHPGLTHPAPSVVAWWCGARGRELANHGGRPRVVGRSFDRPSWAPAVLPPLGADPLPSQNMVDELGALPLLCSKWPPSTASASAPATPQLAPSPEPPSGLRITKVFFAGRLLYLID